MNCRKGGNRQMKIEKLVIYGFGKHEDVTVELGSSINILYGHNEAGKTTIQQFILHILFGFPPRNSQFLRYEPKSGSKYGGQVHLRDPLYGKCMIERVRGKSAGDVKVYFEKGEQGDEKALKRLLRQYDRASFEAIFSFSLLQLQDFEKMDEQQFSRTLLASGTTGVDHLLQIESKMEKEMERLFKKNGRNPMLNQKLNELNTLEQELQEHRKKLDHYAPAIRRLKEIDESLLTIRTEMKRLTDEVRQLTTARQLYPLYVEKETVTKRLQSIGSQQFPADGIGRYETIRHKLTEAEAMVFSLQDEMKRLEQILEEQVEEEKLIGLNQLIAKESDWHRKLSTMTALETEQASLLERQAQLGSRLGMQTPEEMEILIRADASIRKEEEMYERLESLKAYDQELVLIEREQKRLQEALQRISEKAQYVTRPSDEAIAQAKNWPSIQKQMAEAKAYHAIQAQQQQQTKRIGMIFIGLALLLIGYSLINQQYGLLFIASLIPAVALFYLKSRMNDSNAQEMDEILATYQGREQEMTDLVIRVESYEHERKKLKEEKSQLELDMHRLQETYDGLLVDIQQTEQLLQTFLTHYGIDGLPSATIIPELFRMIREIQEVTRQLTDVKKKRAQFASEIGQRMLEAEAILKQDIPREDLYDWIRKEQQRHLQVMERQKAQKMRRSELANELQEKQTYRQFLREQIQTLFQEANVDGEEAYYAAYQIQQEKIALMEQQRTIDLQLAVHGEFEIDMSETDVTLENSIQNLKEVIEEKGQDETVLVEEKAKLENQTTALITGETYSQLQQQFEVEKAQFTELAKVWATKKALAAAIAQMMDELKEKKLPNVLAEASSIFEKLTDGRYASLLITTEGTFEAVSTFGMHFPIIELSQATKEQAYLSLRLALAGSMIETAPFPIIMDDPFVHFDETRLSHIIEVLEQSTAHQFIYFTCHEDMQYRFKRAKTINVSEIGKIRSDK